MGVAESIEEITASRCTVSWAALNTSEKLPYLRPSSKEGATHTSPYLVLQLYTINNQKMMPYAGVYVPIVSLYTRMSIQYQAERSLFHQARKAIEWATTKKGGLQSITLTRYSKGEILFVIENVTQQRTVAFACDPSDLASHSEKRSAFVREREDQLRRQYGYAKTISLALPSPASEKVIFNACAYLCNLKKGDE